MKTKQIQYGEQKKDCRLTAKSKWTYLLLIALLVIGVGIGVFAYFEFQEKKDIGLLEDIEEVRKKYEEQLLRLPQVNGVAIGEREGKLVIVVMVIEKTPEVEQAIPKRLDGYEVVIEEVGVIKPLSP